MQNICNAMTCVVCDYDLLSVLGLTTKYHWLTFLSSLPQSHIRILKCSPSYFQISPEVDCIVLVNRPDSEKVLNPEHCE